MYGRWYGVGVLVIALVMIAAYIIRRIYLRRRRPEEYRRERQKEADLRKRIEAHNERRPPT